jgi:acylpyruvate hydrolase
MELSVKDKTYTAQRVFCIGRNYSEHAREMNDDLPKEPIVFMKHPLSLVPEGAPVAFPPFGRVLHHEVEVVVVIGQKGRLVKVSDAACYVCGLTLGLDLTMRDVQEEMIKLSLPWEKCKSFEQSAPIGAITPFPDYIELDNISFSCKVNGELRQQGNTGQMLFSIEALIADLSKVWDLRPGDLIYTGTPAGIGPLKVGDEVCIESPQLGAFNWRIV